MLKEAMRGFAAMMCAVLLTSLLATGAVRAAGEGEPMLLPVDPAPLVIETAAGEQRFQIEIADDEAERASGLMFRRVMPDDRAMLFVFHETRRVAFWMKNTPMPLDLVFVDEAGVIRSIKQGVPYSEAAIAPPVPVRFVLELKAGTAQKAGIAEGDHLRHPRIEAAGQ
jgi:uncharacterized membrane protein (UPF0127 family)